MNTPPGVRDAKRLRLKTPHYLHILRTNPWTTRCRGSRAPTRHAPGDIFPWRDPRCLRCEPCAYSRDTARALPSKGSPTASELVVTSQKRALDTLASKMKNRRYDDVPQVHHVLEGGEQDLFISQLADHLVDVHVVARRARRADHWTRRTANQVSIYCFFLFLHLPRRA